MKLIDDNSEVPDIEKLERQDFNLDTEEQQLLTAESDEQVKQVRFHLTVKWKRIISYRFPLKVWY